MPASSTNPKTGEYSERAAIGIIFIAAVRHEDAPDKCVADIQVAIVLDMFAQGK